MMLKKIIPVCSILLVIYLGWIYMDEYLFMHPYYATMLHNWSSIQATLLGLIFALIPTAYILFQKKKNIRVLLGTIIGSAIGFALLYISAKTSLYGGGLSVIIHHVFLLGLAFFFFLGLESLGHLFKERFLKLETTSLAAILLNLGIGLVLFLLVVYVLVLANLLYSILSWLLLAGLAFLLWIRKEQGKQKRALVEAMLVDMMPSFHHIWYLPFSLPLVGYGIAALLHGEMSISVGFFSLIGIYLIGLYILQSSRKRDWGTDRLFSVEGFGVLLLIILLLLTFWYLFHGFQLAYLPYPTAWDANHAYMFYPKMWAFNHGYYWNEPSMGGGMGFWSMYIVYFFSLFTGFTSFLGISADTIAIEMNFWSGILVLIFGLGLITEFLSFLRKGKGVTIYARIAFLLGWFLLLQRLFSGMGAFLVFIDNKTDMGVLALIILAAYSGFTFLNKLSSEPEDTQKHTRNIWIYVCLSGIFYGIAAFAKATALFDVVNFGLFLWIIWFGWIGALGAIFLVMGGMTSLKFRGIEHYIPKQMGWLFLIPGVVGISFDIIRVALKKAWFHARFLLGWTGCIVATLFVVKIPFYLINDIAYGNDIRPAVYMKNVLLGSSGGEKEHFMRWPLLAQVGDAGVGSSCTLAGQGFSNIEELYVNTEEAPGDAYNEDVGRYVGFGWKGNLTTDARRKVIPLLNPWWATFFSPGCYGFNLFSSTDAKDATVLCKAEQSLEQLQIDGLRQVLPQLSSVSMSNGRSVKEKLEQLITLLETSDSTTVAATYAPDINDLRSFMQSNTIKIEDADGMRKVYVPYKYLTPSNITFNRSLQNLSSYYTDIGIIRLILFIFAFVGLCYGIVIQKRKLVAISLVTIFGWVLWWMIGGAILWYAIGIIVWSILAFVAYVWHLLTDDDTSVSGIVFLLAFCLIAGYQMTLNMVRISSQGGGGAFIWYKTNHGMSEEYNEQLQVVNSINPHFTHEEVFAMQFPHYRKFLALANARTQDEGALIAGTYARYFVKKQQHIQYDQFLTWLREMFSDNDVCNSYLRLQDQNIKYLVIDPNIGTVVQGAGNQSLFDRFFARVDNTGNHIVEHGTMTMLMEMYRSGYIRYVSSNNLGAKYAFILPDSTFVDISGDTLTLARSRMALARFFNNAAIINSIVEVAKQRVADGMFMTDLADLLGVTIRENHLLDLIKKGQLIPTDIAALTQDERKILGQYLTFRQLATTQPEQYTQQLQSIVKNSIGGGNQIIVLELVQQ